MPDRQQVVITDVWITQVPCCEGFVEILAGSRRLIRFFISQATQMPFTLSFRSGLVFLAGETITVSSEGMWAVQFLLVGYQTAAP